MVSSGKDYQKVLAVKTDAFGMGAEEVGRATLLSISGVQGVDCFDYGIRDN